MKLPEPDADDERPISWVAIQESTPVHSVDGEEIGTTHEVLGSQEEDIFHGLVVSHGALGSPVMIPAEHVKSITNRRIDVDLNADAIRALPPFQEHPSFHLGMVGLFRKHVGWIKEDEQPR